MRDPKRIDKVCDELKEIWSELPDWRFFQLMVNFMRACGDPFFIEDDRAMEILRGYVDAVKEG